MVNSFRTGLVAPLVMLMLVGMTSLFAPAAEARHWSGQRSQDLGTIFFYKAVVYLRHADEIGLTEDQVDKILKLKLAVKKEMIRKGADLAVLDLDLLTALREEKIDVKAVNLLVDQKFEVKKAMTKFSVQALADLKGILTPEQYAKMKDIWRGKKPTP